MAHLTGPMVYPVPTTGDVPSSTPKIKLGTRARDDAGNEYVYVDFSAAFVKGEVVAISTAFAATDVTTATVGAIGVTVKDANSSDTCGWVQIYGSASVLGSSLLVIGPVGLDDTTGGVSYLLPLTTALIQVSGLYVTLGSTASSGDYSSAASSDISSQMASTVTAQLNYPYIEAGVHATETS